MLFCRFSELVLFVLLAFFQEQTLAIKKSYVVYLGGLNHGLGVTAADLDRVTDSHTQLLASFLGSKEKANDAIFYSYKKHINGFASLLEEEEAAEISKHPDVVSVFLNEGLRLHTTHSWDFLELEKNGIINTSSAWKKARFGQDSIIANLDTGVWPESKSFSGEGYGPIPSRWKGICPSINSTETICNRKLIGARYFNKGYEASIGKPLNSSFQSARDYQGHGTHTLSTAAGNFVPGASIFGMGNGTARGGSPQARVAAYKVCWPDGCFDADIMEGFEMAIQDGVDVVSVSLGGPPTSYILDSVAIGAFHAVRNGIVVVASAGNLGPDPGSVSNVAPWIITVGASTIDRVFQANVHLKNGSILMGSSLYQPSEKESFYPLISAENARSANAPSIDEAILCNEGTLDPKKVKGKIVVCSRGEIRGVEKGMEAARAGAAGMIITNELYNGNDIQVDDAHVLPATLISYADGLILMDYINSTRDPQALITSPKTILNIKPSPIMGAFSSRGPNTVTPHILKPDITAPGVSIIAAYSEGISLSGLPSDKGTSPFNSLSGTSMSCPHVSGVVGLLKTLHPDWSPAAIKSAIMTTATTVDNTGKPLHDSGNSNANPFAYGSGHIEPNQAVDPGLVYDLGVNDYLDFLCGSGYNETDIRKISGSAYKCPGKEYSILNFNYPSISVLYTNGTVTARRKVKNVGPPGTYAARLDQPANYTISVTPSVLKFVKAGEEKSFELSINASTSTDAIEFGQLTWSDGSHYVNSPIAIYSPTYTGLNN